MYTFTLGDHCVVRHEITQEERYGKVLVVAADGRYPGSGVVELLGGSRVRILPSGSSVLGYFTLIKHVPAKELVATKKHDPYLNPHQQQIKDWLDKRRAES